MDKLTLGTRNVSIEFPGVKALTDVNFEVSTGEIRALVGANGAGKSTLMKVFAGANPDYTGEVYLNDKVVELRTPMAAKKLGIQIVYQEVDMALVPTPHRTKFHAAPCHRPVKAQTIRMLRSCRPREPRLPPKGI